MNSIPSHAQPPLQPDTSRPFDVELLRARLFLKDWSYFTGDSYLMVNPEEAKPQNEPRLTAKILKHYGTIDPSYFQFQPRAGIAASLASHVPLSVKSRKDELVKELSNLYLEEKTGQHPDHAKKQKRYAKPYESQLQFWQDPHELKDKPAMREFQTNMLALSLILNEGLKARGRATEAAGYVEAPSSPDDVIARLSPLLDIPPLTLTQTLQQKGVDGFAELLGVKPELTAEIKQLAEKASGFEYANNLVQNWNIGRSVEGMQLRTLDEKIQVGLLVRTAKKLEEIKHYEFPKTKPADIQKVEDQVIASLRQLPQPLLEAFYYSGGEIALTPAKTVEAIFGFPVPALGLHNHAPFQRGKPGGVLQVYASSMYSPGTMYNIIAHEMNHLQYPWAYSAQEIARMDELVTQNAARLSALEQQCVAWERAKTPDARRAIEAEMNRAFGSGGVTLEQALGGPVTESGIRELRKYVFDAHKNLDPHSDHLPRGYHSPELRATELVSRYSELKFYKLESRPAMLQFIAPEMTALYEQCYLPHLQRELEAMKNGQRDLPPHMQFAGFQPMPEAKAPLVPAPPQPKPLTVAEAGQLKLVDTPVQMIASPAAETANLSKGKGFAQRIAAQAVETAVEQSR